MGKVSGVNKHKARMLSLAGPLLEEKLGGVLAEGAQNIVTDAAISITTGSVSGKNHVASLPGEAPNNDVGDLVRGLEDEKVGPLHYRATSNAPHAAPLEFGTSKMAPRPYMSPAAQRKRPEIVEKAVKAINQVLRSTPNGS